MAAASRSKGYPAGIDDAGERKAIASVNVVPRSSLRMTVHPNCQIRRLSEQKKTAIVPLK
jgi:hypothetical protein